METFKDFFWAVYNLALTIAVTLHMICQVGFY